MYFFGPKSREFSYINYLAVKIAFEVQNPDAIYFYYNKAPENNPHWEAIRPYVTMVQMDPPTEYDGVSIEQYPQYQADVVRVQKLYEHGGIYLDTDCLLMKSLDNLRGENCVMSGFVKGVSRSPNHTEESMSGQMIMCQPKSEFMKIWLERMGYGLRKDIWAWHNVCLPVEIYKERPDLITLLEMEEFMPFDFRDYSILDPQRIDESLSQNSRSYAVHLWETIWQNELSQIGENYFLTVDNAFTRLFKKHAKVA